MDNEQIPQGAEAERVSAPAIPESPSIPAPVAIASSSSAVIGKVIALVLGIAVIGGGGFAYMKYQSSNAPASTATPEKNTATPTPLATRHIKIDEFGFEFDLYNPWKGSKVSNVDRQTPVGINLYPEQSKSPDGKFIGPYVLVYAWYLDDQTAARLQSGVSLAQISKEELASTGNVKMLNILSERSLSVSDLPAYTATYTGQLPGHTETSKIMGLIINNGKIDYVINYVATEASFDVNLAEAMIIFNSFSVDRNVVIPTPTTSP